VDSRLRRRSRAHWCSGGVHLSWAEVLVAWWCWEIGGRTVNFSPELRLPPSHISTGIEFSASPDLGKTSPNLLLTFIKCRTR
jgi:hypothetical protein